MATTRLVTYVPPPPPPTGIYTFTTTIWHAFNQSINVILGMFAHSSTSVVLGPLTVLGGCSRPRTRLSTMFQPCSFGFRSGEQAGQSMASMPSSPRSVPGSSHSNPTIRLIVISLVSISIMDFPVSSEGWKLILFRASATVPGLNPLSGIDTGNTDGRQSNTDHVRWVLQSQKRRIVHRLRQQSPRLQSSMESSRRFRCRPASGCRCRPWLSRWLENE